MPLHRLSWAYTVAVSATPSPMPLHSPFLSNAVVSCDRPDAISTIAAPLVLVCNGGLSNEERMEDLAGWPNSTGIAAAAQIAAMRARAAQVNPKIAPLLRFVLGSDAGSDAGGNVVADGTVIGNTTAIFRQMKAMAGAEACSELVFDWHVTPGQIDNGSNHSSVNPNNLEKLDRLARDEGCGGANVAVLETNKCDSHFDRALANAVTASAAQRWSKIIVAHCESQCWTAAGHADGCGEGHIEVLQNQTWGTPACKLERACRVGVFKGGSSWTIRLRLTAHNSNVIRVYVALPMGYAT